MCSTCAVNFPWLEGHETHENLTGDMSIVTTKKIIFCYVFSLVASFVDG